MSWLGDILGFSDWGTSAWAEDIDSAQSYAEQVVEVVADERGWSDAQLEYGGRLINEAYKRSDGVQDFWENLALLWSPQSVDGWLELEAVWDSAAVTSSTVSDSREAGSFSEVVGGALGETAEELGDAGRATVDWLPLIVGVAVVGGVAIVAWRVTR